jgi:hypothetical protein
MLYCCLLFIVTLIVNTFHFRCIDTPIRRRTLFTTSTQGKRLNGLVDASCLVWTCMLKNILHYVWHTPSLTPLVQQQMGFVHVCLPVFVYFCVCACVSGRCGSWILRRSRMQCSSMQRGVWRDSSWWVSPLLWCHTLPRFPLSLSPNRKSTHGQSS